MGFSGKRIPLKFSFPGRARIGFEIYLPELGDAGLVLADDDGREDGVLEAVTLTFLLFSDTITITLLP